MNIGHKETHAILIKLKQFESLKLYCNVELIAFEILKSSFHTCSLNTIFQSIFYS